MTPTEEINIHLSAARAAIGDMSPNAESAFQMLEMHARSIATQLVTRNEYAEQMNRHANEKHAEAEAARDEAKTAKKRVKELEDEPKRKNARRLWIEEQQAALAAELAGMQ